MSFLQLIFLKFNTCTICTSFHLQICLRLVLLGLFAEVISRNSHNETHARIQNVGHGVRPPPLKNHKNIGFQSNFGQDPLNNHKAAKPAFNVGPSTARQRNADVFSLAGRWWSAYSHAFGFYPLHQPNKPLAECDPDPL